MTHRIETASAARSVALGLDPGRGDTVTARREGDDALLGYRVAHREGTP